MSLTWGGDMVQWLAVLPNTCGAWVRNGVSSGANWCYQIAGGSVCCAVLISHPGLFPASCYRLWTPCAPAQNKRFQNPDGWTYTTWACIVHPPIALFVTSALGECRCGRTFHKIQFHKKQQHGSANKKNITVVCVVLHMDGALF